MTPSAARYLLGVGVAVLLIPLMLIIVMASSDGTPNLGLTSNAQQLLKPGAPVPPRFLPWVNKAGKLCSDIGPALVAAQIDLESGWREDAVAENPAENGGNAMGLAQFQAGTWSTWGSDADGDGKNSPFDGEDAIMALAKFMCSNVSWAQNQLLLHTVTGDPIELALATYFCGRQCILDAHGVPPTGKAHDYPKQVLNRLAKYGQPIAVGAQGKWTLPLAKGAYRIVSGFGPRGGRLHAGTDFSAPKGTPIYAASDGKVLTVTCQAGNNNCDVDGGTNVSGCGWYVDIQHAGNIVTRYCHQLKKPLVKPGQSVKAGQQIGVVGTSGNSSGPHLHFEVHKLQAKKRADNSNATDPIPFLRSVKLDP